jgi:hypothetical protein
MPSAWNMFVKKVYEEGKAKDSSYEFKQALVDASKRKSEMSSIPAMKKRANTKRSRGKKMSSSLAVASVAGGRRTRRRNSRRHSRRNSTHHRH